MMACLPIIMRGSHSVRFGVQCSDLWLLLSLFGRYMKGARMPSGSRFSICSIYINRKSRRLYIRRTENRYLDMTHSEPIPDRRINILHYIIRELQTNGTSRFPILTGCQSELFAETKKPVSGIKINMYRDIKCVDTNWQDWSAIALVIAYSDKLSAKDRVQAVAEVYGQLYEENGHFLGQYFRNMYYVLNTIDQSSLNDTNKAYYAHLYRAQLSRYELALGVFNAVWEKSSFDMVRLLLKYDILDDVYREDIVLFEKGEGKDDFAYHRVKDLLKEYQTMEKERQEQTSSLFTV